MKKEIDKKVFMRAHEMVEEIVAAIEEGKKITECDTIHHFVNDPKHCNQMREKLERGDMFDKTYHYIQSRNKSNDIKSLIGELNSKKRSGLSLKRIALAASVAAALIAITLIVRMEHNSLLKNVTYISYEENPLAPKTPTLILSNGETVELSNVENGKASSVEFEKVGDCSLKYNSEAAPSESVKYNTIFVPLGFMYTLELADGSKVTMNAGSKLIYPVQFNSHQRVVKLEGEAFFDIVKSEIPFVVESQSGNVKVYGTTFNLYSKQNSLEAVLVSGNIGFTPNNKSEVMLEAGQMLLCDSDGSCSLKEVNTYEYTAWRDNHFIFIDQPLERVLTEISKWYGVEIGYTENYHVDDNFITLMLSRNTSLDVVLKTISETLQIKLLTKERRVDAIE